MSGRPYPVTSENPGFWETIGNFNEKDIAVGGILYPTLSGVAINQLGGKANNVVNTGLGIFVGASFGLAYAYFRSASRLAGYAPKE